MATYKVVDAEQLNADMSSVADSIRTKGGTTDALAWPDGYKTAIDSIPAGGAPSLQSKSVTYTANSTATITPDVGYDALSSVDVAANASGGSIGEIFRGAVIPTKETPPSELFVTLPNGEQMTITDLWSSNPADIWNKIVLNGKAVSFSIINTTDSYFSTSLQIKQINIDFYTYHGEKTKRVWRRCIKDASAESISDKLCFKTGSKYVYYWI